MYKDRALRGLTGGCDQSTKALKITNRTPVKTSLLKQLIILYYILYLCCFVSATISTSNTGQSKIYLI